jgi:hypothetical protein
MKVNQGGRPRKIKPVPIDAIIQGSNISPLMDPELSSAKIPLLDISNNLNFGSNHHIDPGDDFII